MSDLSQCHESGILLVHAKPTSPGYLSDFHDWYDTEHGPARLKLGHNYFSNGYRYKSRDKDTIWLAMYEMKKMSAGADPVYTALRENRSPREREVFRRKLLVLSRQFLRLEAVSGSCVGPSAKLCCISFSVRSNTAQTVSSWYCKEVFRMFQSKQNCLRSRLFRLVDGTGKDDNHTFFLGIHDFGTDGMNETSEARELVESTFRRQKSIMVCPTVQTFDFHREFSAYEYRTPPTADAGEPSFERDEHTNRGRL